MLAIWARLRTMVFCELREVGRKFSLSNDRSVQDLKIVGVNWSNKLTWNTHFDNTIKAYSQ